jgi:DNA recombination protein RmuC
LVQTFEALSDKALRRNNQTFFELANDKLGPLQKSLEIFDSKLQEVEKQRVGAYAGVSQQISNLLTAQNELRSQTANLVGALKTPRIRGRWGEIQLKRVVEIAGMLDHRDFFEQQSGDAARRGSRKRPRPEIACGRPSGGRGTLLGLDRLGFPRCSDLTGVSSLSLR